MLAAGVLKAKFWCAGVLLAFVWLASVLADVLAGVLSGCFLAQLLHYTYTNSNRNKPFMKVT